MEGDLFPTTLVCLCFRCLIQGMFRKKLNGNKWKIQPKNTEYDIIKAKLSKNPHL